MINLFYHPGYAKRKKRTFTLNLKNSRLLNVLIDLFYVFNVTFPDRYITNGPHKLMNNLIRTFKSDKNFKFNKLVYNNTYIVQFDDFGENVLKQIIETENSDKKVLIGPLYTLDQLKNLISYFKQYDYINIAVASKATFDLVINDIDPSLDRTRISIVPSGVVSLKILQNAKYQNRNNKCLIYFKNRNDLELQTVKDFLKKLNIEFDLFEYKKYKNKRLKKISKINRFGILLTTTESQGFAVQEMLSCNLPLFVWDSQNAYYDDIKVSGTSVPFWDERCGIKVNNFYEFTNSFEIFIKNLSKFEPAEMIKENLTFEVAKENLIKEFQ